MQLKMKMWKSKEEEEGTIEMAARKTSVTKSKSSPFPRRR